MIVTDIQQGLMFAVNPVGSLIWERLTEGLSPDEVARQLAKECSLFSGL
jgi:Coenzyme PQQ synthesis protein D (PqqD)